VKQQLAITKTELQMAVAHTTEGWKNMTKLRREVLYVPGVNVILSERPPSLRLKKST